MSEKKIIPASQVDYKELLQKRKHDFKKPAAKDKVYLEIEDSVIGTAGNFITLTGLPKAGKSTFTSCIIASVLTDTFPDILGFKAVKHPGKEKIVLFDTEQGNYDFQNQIQRIKWLAQYNAVEKKMDAFLVREDDSHDIISMVHEYLKANKNVGYVVIDGLLDLIDNMNDEGASKRLIKYLKKWASVNDCLLITVLHLGKKDNSSIGHVGSACDRYAQSVLNIEKTKEGTYRCAAKFLRSGKDFDPIEIYRDKITGNYYSIK